MHYTSIIKSVLKLEFEIIVNLLYMKLSDFLRLSLTNPSGAIIYNFKSKFLFYLFKWLLFSLEKKKKIRGSKFVCGLHMNMIMKRRMTTPHG